MTAMIMRRLVLLSVVLAFDAAAQTPDRLVFATDWLAEAEHGGFYQALAEGTYAKYGLIVTFKPYFAYVPSASAW